MHYGCTALVVSAMVGGVVAYVAWQMEKLYWPSRFPVSDTVESSSTLIRWTLMVGE